MIPHAELLQLLSYDPFTGVFRWINDRQPRIKAGTIAGTISPRGYRLIWVCGKQYRAHRLAWFYITKFWPVTGIDHKNHSLDDNSFNNLREADQNINNKNTSKRYNNKSGTTGVNWSNRSRAWQAQIQVNKKKIHLGYFTDIQDAIAARKAANIKYNFHPNHGN